MTTRAHSTQWIVNSYPDWSATRSDEQSLGFRLGNAAAVSVDGLLKGLVKGAANNYLPSSVVSDLDVFYTTSLPGTYKFTKNPLDTSSYRYTPPEVFGLRDGSWQAVSMAPSNTTESFWYETLPNGIFLESTDSSAFLLVSSTVGQGPWTSPLPLGEVSPANVLSISLSGGESYLGSTDNNFLRKGVVQISGVSEEGLPLTEEIVFLEDEDRKTTRSFKSIDAGGIRCYGVEPSGTSIIVKSMGFQQTDYPSAFPIDTDALDNEMPLFWAISTGTLSSGSTLDLRIFENAPEMRLEGFVSKDIFCRQELLTSGGANITAMDLTVEPYSSNLWLVDDHNLYLFDANIPYPDTSLLDKKQMDASSVIETNKRSFVRGETLELDFLWARPSTGMVSHRAWVKKPDGTLKSLENGIEVPYHADRTSWVYGEPTRKAIRPAEFYMLDQLGNYVYTLEVSYTDGSTSVDQRIAAVYYQKPKASFDLTTIGINNPIVGIDIDYRNRLWVLDDVGTKYQIGLHKDSMIIDFDNKIIYFREMYDRVKVI